MLRTRQSGSPAVGEMSSYGDAESKPQSSRKQIFARLRIKHAHGPWLLAPTHQLIRTRIGIFEWTVWGQ